MNRSRIRSLQFAVLACSLLATLPASAFMITADLTRLDATGSQWQADFMVTDATFQAGEGFDIFFNYGDYENLQSNPAPADWEVYSWDPEEIFGFGDPGVFGAIALTDSTSLDNPFSIQFDWLGNGGLPELNYEYFNADFEVLGSGAVSAQVGTVALPGTLALLGAALPLLAGLRRRRS